MNISGHPILYIITKTIIALLFCILVLAPASIVMESGVLPESLMSQAWAPGFINATGMWIMSLFIMLILSKDKLSTFGFMRAANAPWKLILQWGLGVGILATVVGSLLSFEGLTFADDFSFLQIVILIWFYQSSCEEILTRGLIQGFLAPLSKYGFTIFTKKISYPVLIGALFFAAMHLALLTMGVDGPTVLTIVFFAFILGIIAGYYRERTGSLLPAILVHALFNVSGTLIGFLQELLK